jgi:ribonuclease P protein component
MLPKKNRADKKTVDNIFKEGKFINSPHFTFKFILEKSGESRISIIAPKSVSKLAVKRNKLKRLGYMILKKQSPNSIPPLRGVFMFKKYQDDPIIIENEIKEIFSKVR